MLTLEQIRHALTDRNLREVSRRTGIHYMTLGRIKNGQSMPAYPTAQKLSEYLSNG